MRKTVEILLLILTVLLFTTAFVSCKKNETQARASVAKQLSRGFSCTADITYQGVPYGVELTRPSSGTCTMQFTKPAELSQLSFVLDSQGLNVKFGGLTASLDPSSVPQASIFNAVLDAVDTAAKGSGDRVQASGNGVSVFGSTGAGAYTLTLSSKLEPVSLSLPGIGLKAAFHSFSYA